MAEAGVLESLLARMGIGPGGALGGSAPVDPNAVFPAVAPAVDDDAPLTAAQRRQFQKNMNWNRSADDHAPDVPLAQKLLTLAPGADSAGIQLAMDDAPAGTGVPFSTQAGMLAPPVTIPAAAAPGAAPDASAAPASVPLPVPRPPGADAPVPPATDLSSRGRGPGAPVAIAPPAAAAAAADPDETAPATPAARSPSPYSMPSILDKITTSLGNNSNTLLALGAGFAGAPNIGQGISRASAAAIPARAADIKQSLATTTQYASAKAMQDAGVPASLARAALGNPEIMKSVVTNYFGDRKAEIQKISSTDAFGNKTERLVAVDPYSHKATDVTTGAGGAGAPPATGAGAGGAGGFTYAPGVTPENFDHTKVGEDYIAQFSPELQDMAKNYLQTGNIPTGRQSSAQMIKQIATKYGNDVGMPADDSLITQRKEWSKSLGNVQSGVGLQTKGLQQGLEHFSKLSDNLVKMHLSNGFGFEPIAGAINSAKNLTTDQQELVHKSDVEGQALSREMGNLFSKNGGGVHEAAETKKNVSNSTMSSKAAAGSLEAIDELMQGGLSTLENRRDELFPKGNAPKGSTFMGPKQQEALARIRNNIAILKGEKAAAPEAPAAMAAPAVRPTIAGPNGRMILSEDGKSWQPLQ